MIMKRILVAALCIMALAACSKSPQKKAEEIVKAETLKVLYHPETYEAIETVLDSAFTPYLDPSFVNAILDVSEKGAEIDELQEEMKEAKSDMALWSGFYRSAYSQNKYNEAKAKYDEAEAKCQPLVEYIQKVGDQLRAQTAKAPEFIGYIATHSFRVANNAGQTVIDTFYYLLDKDVTNVVDKWNVKEIETYNAFMKESARLYPTE